MPGTRNAVGATVLAVFAALLAACTIEPASSDSSVHTTTSTGDAIELFEVRRGDILSVVSLEGVVAAIPPTTIDSAASGVVVDPIPPSTVVSTGDALLTIERSGADRASVTAPVEGVLTTIIAEGENVSRGDVLATIDSGMYEVRAAVPPELLYRFINGSYEGRVRIRNGPEPFNCAIPPTIVTPQVGGESAELGSGVQVSCQIPAEILVFSGLPVDLAVTVDRRSNVVVVPVTSVTGVVGTASVWVTSEDGTLSERRVDLGLTDGLLVEVTGGLEVGELIADPAPFVDPASPGDVGG